MVDLDIKSQIKKGKEMKKILITIGLLLLFTTGTFASKFMSLSYGQRLEDRVMTYKEDDVTFRNAWSAKLKMGGHIFPVEKDEDSKSLGMYIGATYGSTDKTTYIYKGNAEEFENTSWLFNIGLTYALNNYFVLFGGIGSEFTSASVGEEEDIHHPFYENNFNLNGGLIMYLYESSVGLIVEYDSAPNSVSVGLSRRF